MISIIKKMLSSNLLQATSEATNPTSEEEIDFSLIDASMSGWFKIESNELLTGFDIKPEHSVLDAGCGDGQFTQFCVKMGAEVTYADINEEKVSSVTQRLDRTNARAIHPLVTDGDPFPISDKKMDRILAMEVLEHVDEPSKFLKELVRIGKSGALYLISVPDANSEQIQRALAPATHFQKPNHIHVFSRDQFEKIITEAGLIVEHRHYYGFFWAVWWAFFWICKVDLDAPNHPLLKQWEKTWALLLSQPGGQEVKIALDSIMPKSQAIIARKP